MHEHAERLAGSLVTADLELEREFETRLGGFIDPGVSRRVQRPQAAGRRRRRRARGLCQGVSQLQAVARSDRFRAWLVRMTWRMALDRQRANRRRLARELPVRRRGGSSDPPGRSDDGATADVVAHASAPSSCGQAIDALPEKLRLVVVLAGIEGHDMREVQCAARRAGRHGEVTALSGAEATQGTVVMDGHKHARAERRDARAGNRSRARRRAVSRVPATSHGRESRVSRSQARLALVGSMAMGRRGGAVAVAALASVDRLRDPGTALREDRMASTSALEARDSGRDRQLSDPGSRVPDPGGAVVAPRRPATRRTCGSEERTP